MKFKFSFIGRTAGAIGITYTIQKEYEANDLPTAIGLLYKEYDLLKGIEVNGKKLPFEKIKFDKNDKCIAPHFKHL